MKRPNTGSIIGLMHRGEVILDRFLLKTRVSSGGMGAVWQALDRTTGNKVALKLLGDPDNGDVARFLREAHVLSELVHPHIVRHVEHGLTPAGEPYLVMEWLEGEDLAQRLSRRALTTKESVTLVRRAASALAAAHRRGVVHRDIKPSNLFLVAGDPSQVKVLDFGIARVTDATATLTRTGSVLGTPGYMAPEQARGEPQVGPAADVFSLGCVLFECLTGRPAFRGDHSMALLAKLLLEEPQGVCELRPDLPAAYGALVARMLVKDVRERLSDGATTETALTTLGIPEDPEREETAQPVRRPAQALTDGERRLLSIVIATPAVGGPVLDPAATAANRHLSPKLIEGIRTNQAITPLGAKLEVLANGMLIAILAGAGNPTDQATAAARCALQMHAALPDSRVALITGRSEATSRLPVGEMLEKAARQIDSLAAHPDRGALIDDVTRALLDPRFVVIEDGERAFLQRELSIGEEPRTLLGKASPFVGRDRDIRSLCEQIEEALDEKTARAIVVTGPAGVGKSRLRQELLRRLRGSVPNLAFVVGRADFLGAGAAFASLGSALRTSLEIEAGEPIERQRQKLSAGVRRYVSGDEARRIIAFVGELASVPFPDDDNPRLYAARQSAQIMVDQIEMAYLDLLRAVAKQRPLLIVLEDLHWGDSASVKLLDTALRELCELPFVVLAFARPEVHDSFPKLWAQRNSTAIRLNPLNRRASEKLIKSMLGDSASTETITAIIDRSRGNAFYLEELIRAVFMGYGRELPDTVLGMVEARLGGLAMESRRLLRAASVFGESFWAGGLRELLGQEEGFVRESLADLVAQEILMRKSSRRFAGEAEYGFRHALVREGAYAMLTEQDRALGHKLAGEWLERAGEQDPVVLATHFERGDEPDKAASYIALIAERLLRGGDARAALRATDRGLAAEPPPQIAAQLWVIRSEATTFIGGPEAFAMGIDAAREALRRARSGSRIHSQALYGGLSSALLSNRLDAAGELMGQMLTIEPDPGESAPLAAALSAVIVALLLAGQRAQAALYMDRIQAVVRRGPCEEPLASAWEAAVRGHWEVYTERNPWAGRKHYTRARELLEQVGDRLNGNLTISWQGKCSQMLGAFEEGDEYLRTAVQRDRTSAGLAAQVAKLCRMVGLVERAAAEQAIQVALSSLTGGILKAGDFVHTQVSLLLGDAYLMQGQIDSAERALESSGAYASAVWANDVAARALRARILLARGDAARAAHEADEAIALSRNAGMLYAFRSAATLLIHAEAHLAAGNMDTAKQAIRDARDDLLSRADKMEDPAYRKTFLERMPVHARTLVLAKRWVGEEL